MTFTWSWSRRTDAARPSRLSGTTYDRAVSVRVVALLSAVVVVGTALAVRAVAGEALVQVSGTVLYAAMICCAVLVLAPRLHPGSAGLLATGFCWLVEFAQLTGGPAALSARSTAARYVLGSRFDPIDLFWYPVGAALLAAWFLWYTGRFTRRGRAAR
jgi:hypothetical protein